MYCLKLPKLFRYLFELLIASRYDLLLFCYQSLHFGKFTFIRNRLDDFLQHQFFEFALRYIVE